MTDNVVERAARAVCQEFIKRMRPDIKDEYIAVYVDTVWKTYIPEARAAIASLREPSLDIIEAGAANIDAGWAYPNPLLVARTEAGAAFDAMIDKILESK